jgi:hypothetical protein
MKLGQLLMPFCRWSQTVAVGLTATLMIVVPVTGKRAVLGRFMGMGWTAAATPTAIQSFWRLLG